MNDGIQWSSEIAWPCGARTCGNYPHGPYKYVDNMTGVFVNRDWMQNSNKKLLSGTTCSLSGSGEDFIGRKSFFFF